MPKGLPRDKAAWALAQTIAKVTLQGRMHDITKGSTFYHTTAVRPYWTASLVKTKKVGHHIFIGIMSMSSVTYYIKEGKHELETNTRL